MKKRISRKQTFKNPSRLPFCLVLINCNQHLHTHMHARTVKRELLLCPVWPPLSMILTCHLSVGLSRPVSISPSPSFLSLFLLWVKDSLLLIFVGAQPVRGERSTFRKGKWEEKPKPSCHLECSHWFTAFFLIFPHYTTNIPWIKIHVLFWQELCI